MIVPSGECVAQAPHRSFDEEYRKIVMRLSSEARLFLIEAPRASRR